MDHLFRRGKTPVWVLLLVTLSFCATVTGVVTDETGAAVPSATVKVWGTGSYLANTTTNASGVYSVEAAVTGSTYVYTSKQDYFTGCTRVTNPGATNVYMQNIPDYKTKISPLLFGGNYYNVSGSLDNGTAASECINIMRMGGCCWDACEPTESETWNTRYVGAFLSYCEDNNLEPYVQMPLLHRGTDEVIEMMEDECIPAGVKYYSISNEPWRYDEDAGSSYWMSVAEYESHYRDRYHAIKEMDSSAIVCGAELGEWNTQFITTNNAYDIVDIFTHHNYPFGGTQSTAQTLSNPPSFGNYISQTQTSINLNSNRELPQGLTEYNLSYSNAQNSGSSASFYAGIWMADVIGRLINSHYIMSNIWCFADDYDFTSIGTIAHDGTKRATYWAMYMYRNGMLEYYDSTTCSQDDLGIYASQDASGNICFIGVNRNQSSNYDATIDFTASSKPNIKIRFPALSVVRVTVNASGSVTEIMKLTESQSNGPVSDASLEITSSTSVQVSIIDQITSVVPKTDGLTIVQDQLRTSPNPVRSAARISYAVTAGNEALKQVSLGVYNVQGRLVKRLVQEKMSAGSYHVEWDGRNSSNRPVVNGLYFVRGQIGEKTMSKRMLLVR